MNPRLERRLNGDWRPATPSDADMLASYKVGEPLEIKSVVRHRNPDHHKKFFVLIDLVFENQDRYPTKKALRNDLLLKAGFYETHINYWRHPDDPPGVWAERVIKYPMSMAYDSMNRDEFEECYDKVVAVVLEIFFPEMERVGLEQELLEFASNWSG